MAAAQRLGKAARYRSAGTIEFLVDQDTAKFYFLEVNTRLQVRRSLKAMAAGGVPVVSHNGFSSFHSIHPCSKLQTAEMNVLS